MSDKLKTNLVQIEQQNRTSLQVSGLTKSFGRTRVLNDLDLSIEAGEVLSVLGSNGSGKTTLINIISTLAKPDRGIVNICGYSIEKHSNQIRSSIGLVGHSPMLYSEMTGLENLTFFGRLFRVESLNNRITETADKLGISNILDQKVGNMSHGMQKRIAIARSLLSSPKLLLMDEPESGLDQSAVGLLRVIINDLKKSTCAVLLVTHSLDQAVNLGDRVAILSNGKVGYDQATELVDIKKLTEKYFEYSDQFKKVKT
ncbi:MAG: sodium ABC transporter ATP-binding protein [Dehalococcoidia bacterium]|nr:sodium ABC transporter ATP-binding protein [Dehalococcoidia bacterium]MQG16364.1 ABC transporter ATP-binding protein [SAR202 cluster bacterium]|tara:strand:+ start:35585 stop:36355 length:771 start_codon:yes stop_codon:yes gene_type:complete